MNSHDKLAVLTPPPHPHLIERFIYFYFEDSVWVSCARCRSVCRASPSPLPATGRSSGEQSGGETPSSQQLSAELHCRASVRPSVRPPVPPSVRPAARSQVSRGDRVLESRRKEHTCGALRGSPPPTNPTTLVCLRTPALFIPPKPSR